MQKEDININLKEIIKAKMDELGGKIPFDEAKELIRPHFVYNIGNLTEKALEAKTRSIIRTLRDKKNTRIIFSNDECLYINVEKVTEIEELERIEKQLWRKLNGLKKSLKKIRNQKKELAGQLSLFESEAEIN